jgi:hypothetical protein
MTLLKMTIRIRMESGKMNRTSRTVVAGFAVTMTLAAAGARADLITNGNFASTTGNGEIGVNTSITGWSTTGYNFLFTPGTADKAGAPGSSGPVILWGPNSGSANGLPATSPAGGNFVALDGNYGVGALTQSVSGLTVGNTYTLTFYEAGAQQSPATGPHSDTLAVSLGGQTLSTPALSTVSMGFSGWTAESLTFTASSASEILSFLANGSPSGGPPFILLNDVSLNAATAAVSEPATTALLGTGLLGLGLVVRRRRMNGGAKAA